MSTVNPALARAIARRAVGYQQKVVATKALGFTFYSDLFGERWEKKISSDKSARDKI
jgi:hypothetical protein